MSCEECRTAVRTSGTWNRFDSGRCVWCAARRIQFVKQLKKLPRELISTRCTEILKEAVTRGYDEKQIRALVAGDMAVDPAAKQDVRKNA